MIDRPIAAEPLRDVESIEPFGEPGVISAAIDTSAVVDVTSAEVLRLHDEHATIARRRVETDIVRVETVTRSREALINEPLVHEKVEIERVTIGRFVDAAPDVREEGDTTIIPVIEEVVVVERRLMLKEEVRIRKVRVTEHHRETVILREQEAVITRRNPNAATDV